MSEQPYQPSEPSAQSQSAQSQPGQTQPGQTQPGQTGQPYQPSQPTQKRLVRSRSDRMVAGVCGGVAEYLGIDATLVRILVVVGTVLGFGSLLLAYIIGWVLIPEED
ncbi:MAG TPA: PspC domain-containing protein [Nocardioidaceae bacterium]|nr:PspC domain-containing protein [Nocardioidaceae bacterium]